MIAHKVNDGLIRLISVPIIATLFSNVPGLIRNSRYSVPLLLVQYCFFICLVFLLWQGNIWIVMFVKSRMYPDKISYAKYISVIIISTIIYAWLFIAGLLLIWTKLFIENHTSAVTLLNATSMLAFIATFITLIYENYLLNRKKLSALSKVEQLNLVKTQAELSVLKSQIDPHFIFNSLNNAFLSYCIKPFKCTIVYCYAGKSLPVYSYE